LPSLTHYLFILFHLLFITLSTGVFSCNVVRAGNFNPYKCYFTDFNDLVCILQAKWDDLLIADFIITTELDKVVLTDIVDFNTLQSKQGVIPLTLEKLQKDFSSMTEKEVLIYIGSDVSSFGTLVRQNDTDFDVTSLSAEVREKVEGESVIAAREVLRRVLALDLEQSCEYTMREVISPILIAAVHVMQHSVKLVCEKEIEGTVAKGPVDYVFIYESFDIVLTEAKKFKLDKGNFYASNLVCSAINGVCG
jgi:hypothetical protein